MINIMDGILWYPYKHLLEKGSIKYVEHKMIINQL